jgi:hypothetical protein
VESTAEKSVLDVTVTSISVDFQISNNLFFSVLMMKPAFFESTRDNPFKVMVSVAPKNQKSQLLGDAAPLGSTVAYGK